MFSGNPERIMQGIATEIIVEKKLISDKKKKNDLGREEFLSKYGNGKKIR